ncbi:MAG: relaxase [Burkholderiaceae bacterium]|jgi:conjugal transfer pilus assembly protein TraI|nr:MAG: relaxase [Burkholderiaceae bacterium]
MVPGSAAAAGGAPPFASADPGFEALPIEQLLAEHEPLLGRIKLCYGADRATFDRDLMPLVCRYASYVHLLPATPDNYFKTPGGLLRLGLETAFFALQGTDAHIFSGKATITARRELEPRWRIATFVGGLCCELHRVLSHLIATTAEGEEWPSFMLPLLDWLRQREAPRYFVRWRPRAVEVRGLGLFALPLVVPAAVLEDLRHDDGVIVRQLFASVGGVPQYREHNVLDDLVRRSLALVVDRNLLASADRYGSPQYGSHLERYLVDAMRRLAAGHSAWSVNRDKGRLWFGEDGLFLVWPGAAEDILELLEGDQLAGIPKAPDTLLDILLDAGVLQAGAAGSRVWPIFPAESKVPIDAVKLSSPAIVLAGIEPMPATLGRSMQRREHEPVAPRAAAASHSSRESPEGAVPSHAPSRQLSLIEPDGASPIAHEPSTPGDLPHIAPAAEEPPTASPSADPRPIRLKAPMRLNPAVRQALQEAVDTLNDPPAAAPVFTVREGVFVPLDEFERRGVQPAVALRSLADVGMLHKPDRGGPPTTSRDVRGVPTVGVVIPATHVDGLDPMAFTGSSDGTDPVT